MWFRLSSKTQEPPLAELPEDKSPFSGWPKAIFFTLMLIFAGYGSTHMVAAGDTWVALACGRHFYYHGVNTVEPFSANSHHAGPTDETMAAYAADVRTSVTELEREGKGTGLNAQMLRWYAGKIESFPNWPQWQKDLLIKWHPTGWINQNWLTHLLFYWISYKSPLADAETRVFNSLVYWKFAMYIIAVFVIYYAARVVKADIAIAAIMACFALFVGRSFLDIRPAGFSNLLAPVFLLILLLTTYRSVLYIWLIVPLVVLWCNLHGGYIYVFLMMTAFVSLHLVLALLTKYKGLKHVWLLLPVALSLIGAAITGNPGIFLVLIPCLILDVMISLSDRWYLTIGIRGVVHSIAATAVAFVAMVIFNPFHLTNLTHTYVISFSRYAKTWREVNEWHGAFEWTNPVGTGVPYLYMLIILLAIAAVWALLLLANPDSGQTRRRDRKSESGGYAWPKVDMPVLLVVAMTVAMAVKSRRFIPIGAAVACPIMAMMLDQCIRMVRARMAMVTPRKPAVPGMLAEVRMIGIVGGLLAIAGFGGYWGWEFKKIYLDPWPSDVKYTSIFMRMTASNVKPFGACDFIRENKLSGNMFNYWTEGGFIAWGQDPDPVTGKTPLQLFMDGRAQAAYDVKTYDQWGMILGGGEPALRLYQEQRQPTAADYKAIGDWLDKTFLKCGVWIVLMPSVEFADPQKFFTEALERNANWRPVYYDGSQKILARVTDPRGAKLVTDELTGQAKFADQNARDMSMANWFVQIKDEAAVRDGLQLAIRAFETNPTQESLLLAMIAGRREDLKPQVDQLCRSWVEKFRRERDSFRKVDGYRVRLTAALTAIDYILRYSSDPVERNDLTAFKSKLMVEYDDLAKWARW